MQDLRPNSVFKASAFMPSSAEVQAACRAAKDRGSSIAPPAKRRRLEVIDLSDSSDSDSDSDDGMPDLSKLLRSSPVDRKKTGKNQNAKKAKKAKKADSDDSMDSDSDSDAPRKKGKGKLVPKGKGKGKAKADDDDMDDEDAPPPPPDPSQYNVWMEGGNNVESSAKMTQMVAYLKEWECTGDKTIVFSQCASWPGLASFSSSGGG